jgi:pyruvate,orthophosphate dikinase
LEEVFCLCIGVAYCSSGEEAFSVELWIRSDIPYCTGSHLSRPCRDCQCRYQKRTGRSMIDNKRMLDSSALQVNLERTAAMVTIPEKYGILLEITEGHYGVHKKTMELLTELNHPYVNWAFVLKGLRTLSMGDFYEFNIHPRGTEAILLFIEIYFEAANRAQDEDTRETAVRYLFDYINTILVNSKEYLERNGVILPPITQRLVEAERISPALFRKSSSYIKTSLKNCIAHGLHFDNGLLPGFLSSVFAETYRFWLSQPDPMEWLNIARDNGEALAAYREIIWPLSHDHLAKLLAGLDTLEQQSGAYVDLPDYNQIMNGYLLTADELERAEVFRGHEHLVKLDFLFRMMAVQGLADIHTNILREVNRCLRVVFKEESKEHLDAFLKNIFVMLRQSSSSQDHGGTIMDCLNTLAKEVFGMGDHPLVNTLVEELIRFGFQHPRIGGATADWQVQVNPLHIVNVRSWLEIVAMKPRWTKRLLSALIINLRLGGIFVRDTDLLQKDISGLLNSKIAPAYNLVKQLLRLFPVYFREIGAEGELRDISTRVDEISFRNDKLIYFLRKQCHVESNSLLVPFIEDIFRFWYTGSKEWVKKHVPGEVFDQIETGGEYFDGLHVIFQKIFGDEGIEPEALLAWDKSRAQKEVRRIKGITDKDRERTCLMIRLYQLIHKKYYTEHVDLLRDLEASTLFSLSSLKALKRDMRKKNYYAALSVILDFLAVLKERILSPEKSTGFENIYYKRHIAAGIPSMYGTYQERKFEAVGLSLRLESLATTLFEQLIQPLNLKFITKSTLIRIHAYLWLYVRALELEGISTEGLVSKMKYITSALLIRQFSIDQYIDIFQFIEKGIQNVIRDYYIDAHRSNLPAIIKQIIEEEGNGTADMSEEIIYQYSENFYRSVISSAFGLQVLDNLINGVINTLSAELEKFKDSKHILNLVMAYNPDLTISSIYRPNKKTDNQILIGNKGYFLKQLASFGFPVPQGFIISTEVFRSYDAVVGYKYMFKDLSLRIFNEVKELERVTGKRYGDPENPLLISVRSGATVSLPGMMHSFLNVGINEAIAEGLSRKEGFSWAAWDCYRRFLQVWGMFQGLDRDFFDGIINEFKQNYGISRKMEFSPVQMREMALAYKKAMEERGIDVPDDPDQQLQDAILQVFASWYSDQAKIYRHQMRLSDDWGTAVIVQQMVYGNLNDNSGSGVIFTKDPKSPSSDVTLYGDFIFGVQGDDIVSGLVETYPSSEKQRIYEKRASTISLEKKFPRIFAELKRYAEILVYERGFNHQEIEFTFEYPERSGLYILQTRDMVQKETKKLRILQDTPELNAAFLGAGIGVSGGALCGRAVYSEADIRFFRKREAETPLILIRPDTVPEDVGVILQVEGLLTARGGATSHAAVTIPQLNKVGVVGFSKLKVSEQKGYSDVDACRINKGDFICIDGWSGSVYYGEHGYQPEEAFALSI